MTDQEIRFLIDRGHEERYLEYKESAPWEQLKHKVAKTCLAMANIRDGGTIIIGVEQGSTACNPVGVNSTDLATYNEDDAQDFVNRYADPYVRLTLGQIEHQGNEFLFLHIQEFEKLPVVCKRDYPNVLKCSALYTRPYGGRPRTCSVQSQSEMREMIDVAIEKGLRGFLATAGKAGIVLGLQSDTTDPDQEAFDEELGEL